MAHFAKIEDGIVRQVIVVNNEVLHDDKGVEQESIGVAFCQSLFGADTNWVQTSYNTQANKHVLGGTPIRGNYAGIGYIYNKDHDVFYPPQPFASWSISESTDWVWTPPTPMPTDDKRYTWNEANKTWDEVTS